MFESLRTHTKHSIDLAGDCLKHRNSDEQKALAHVEHIIDNKLYSPDRALVINGLLELIGLASREQSMGFYLHTPQNPNLLAAFHENIQSNHPDVFYLTEIFNNKCQLGFEIYLAAMNEVISSGRSDMKRVQDDLRKIVASLKKWRNNTFATRRNTIDAEK